MGATCCTAESRLTAPSALTANWRGTGRVATSTEEVRRQDASDESELRISRTVLAAVVEEKKALAFLDVSGDAKLSRVQSIIVQGIRSMICAPLSDRPSLRRSFPGSR